jgi:hypothetical protein
MYTGIRPYLPATSIVILSPLVILQKEQTVSGKRDDTENNHNVLKDTIDIMASHESNGKKKPER